jgi:hypothetical protein
VTERVLLENEKWSQASLRIGGETLQPADIEAALGLRATRTHLKGQPRSERVPVRKAVWQDSMWLLSSPLGEERYWQNICAGYWTQLSPKPTC